MFLITPSIVTFSWRLKIFKHILYFVLYKGVDLTNPLGGNNLFSYDEIHLPFFIKRKIFQLNSRNHGKDNKSTNLILVNPSKITMYFE